LWIVVGATIFVHIYTAVGAQDLVRNIIIALPVSPVVILIGIQLTFFVMGMFLDPTGIVLLTAPVFVPVAVSLGWDPIWFGILYAINMEMGFLTPPFGVNLFYLKGIVPSDVTMADIYRAIVPFVGLQAIGLIIVILFPQIAVWLPNQIFGLQVL
ncbi:TRAP transporter large permease subunit, partial [Chloroflexota bacterium]